MAYSDVPGGGGGGHVPYSPQTLLLYGANSGLPTPQMKYPAYAPDLEEVAPTESVFFSFAGSKLLPDFFLDDEGYDPHALLNSQRIASQAASQESPSGGVAKTFEAIKGACTKELVDTVKGIFEFHLEGKEPGVWYLDLENDSGEKYFNWDLHCTRFLGLILLLFGKLVCR